MKNNSITENIHILAAPIRRRLVECGKDFELYLIKRTGISLVVKDGKRDSFDIRDSIGYAIRLFSNGKYVFGFGSEFSEKNIDELIKSLHEDLDLMPAQDFALPEIPEQHQNTGDLAIFDENLNHHPLDSKWQLAEDLCRHAYAHDSRIIQVPQAGYDDELEVTYLCNSAGRELSQKRSSVQLSLAVIASGEDGDETAFGFRHGIGLDDVKDTTLVHEVCDKVISLLGGDKIQAKRLPAIIRESVMAEFLEILADAINAEKVLSHTSFLEGRLNQRVFHDKITLVDDGRLCKGFATTFFDAEGYPRQKTTVVKNGMLLQYITDSSTAQKGQWPRTGNALRELLSEKPQVSVSNFYLAPGTDDLESELSKLSEAIEVVEVLGMHMADPVSGNFSVGFQGFELKMGKRTRVLKSMTVSGNLFEMLSDVLAVGSSHKYFGNFGAPPVLFSSLMFSG